MVATPCGFKSRSRHSLAGAEALKAVIVHGFQGFFLFVPAGKKDFRCRQEKGDVPSAEVENKNDLLYDRKR